MPLQVLQWGHGGKAAVEAASTGGEPAFQGASGYHKP